MPVWLSAYFNENWYNLFTVVTSPFHTEIFFFIFEFAANCCHLFLNLPFFSSHTLHVVQTSHPFLVSWPIYIYGPFAAVTTSNPITEAYKCWPSIDTTGCNRGTTGPHHMGCAKGATVTSRIFSIWFTWCGEGVSGLHSGDWEIFKVTLPGVWTYAVSGVTLYYCWGHLAHPRPIEAFKWPFSHW